MCNRQDNQTDEKIISAIENIMQLILVEEWDEAQRKLIQELSDCPNNVGLISVLPFINSKINLLDDNDNQKVLLYVSPDWRSQLELIRNRVLTNYYLKKCEESCCVSSEKELYSATTPLLEDVNYQSAMKYASVERKKELTAIQYKQTEQFILLCMKENNVSSETELQHVLLPLADNLNFQKAQKYTSPERQKDLLRIQNNQVEFFLQLCMKDNHVEREVELQYVPQVLSSNKNYQLAVKYASSERKVELKKIQYKQIEYLFKCFLYNHKSILSRIVEPLTQDKDYQQLLELASPSLQYDLRKIQDEQKALSSHASQKEGEAFYQLYNCYHTGIKKDSNKAIEYLHKAAKNGYTEAMFQLYKSYHNGIDVKRDDKEALEWLEAAAEQGHQEAKSTYQGIKMAIRNRLDDGALERGVII